MDVPLVECGAMCVCRPKPPEDIAIVQGSVMDGFHLCKLVQRFERCHVADDVVFIQLNLFSRDGAQVCNLNHITKSMKFSNMAFWLSGTSPPPQSLINVIGRWMVQTTLQLFALSLPRAAVPQFEGAFVTQDRSSVRAMSAQIASITSLPSTAPLPGETFCF